MIFARWRARRASIALIEQLRGEIVAAARRPALYETLGAPDRSDGRFELLTLHVGLVLRRLVAIGGLGHDIAQDLVNSVFLHFDDTSARNGVERRRGFEAPEKDQGGVLRPERRLCGGARFGSRADAGGGARAQCLRRSERRAARPARSPITSSRVDAALADDAARRLRVGPISLPGRPGLRPEDRMQEEPSAA